MHFNQRPLLIRLISKANADRSEDITRGQIADTYRTNPYPLETPVTGSSIIFALLQLVKGRINLGSLSFRKPRTGFRKTATKSELEVSGARSPTKMLYSF